MIDTTFPVDLDALAGMDLEDQLDALLTVADGEALAYCEACGCYVPYDESDPASSHPDDDARVCHACHDIEQVAVRAELDRELDAMHHERRHEDGDPATVAAIDGVQWREDEDDWDDLADGPIW